MENLINKITHADCLEVLKTLPDNAVDLLLTDPPYGINADRGMGRGQRRNKNLIIKKGWDAGIPPDEYFQEMLRVSKNAIIWGGNYFPFLWKTPSRCVLVWDKLNPGKCFAEVEMAWTSFDQVARLFRLNVVNADNYRFHPTQKPLKLFEWCIGNYSKENDLILDCFSGSGTTAIACHRLDRRFICIEKDKDYFNASIERLAIERAQGSLF